MQYHGGSLIDWLLAFGPKRDKTFREALSDVNFLLNGTVLFVFAEGC